MSEAGGILYDPDAHAVTAMEEAGKYSDVLPYAVVVSHTGFGTCYSVLYVGPEKEEWSSERPDRDGFVMSYTYNADAPECSEFGSIGVTGANGGLVRTA